jgi:Leucine-rich repeat (LRR) protein
LIIPVLHQCKDTGSSLLIIGKKFLNALIKRGVNTNSDGIISLEEAREVIFLDVRARNIADMKGIEAFINLETLDCADNKITRFNLSNNSALTSLNCGNNQITSLNVSNNTALIILSCGKNSLLLILWRICNA